MSDKYGLIDMQKAKAQGQKIAAISCYDYTTASIVAKTDIEMVLVGDSAAQVMLGYDSTLPATMDFMVEITAAVRRAVPNKILVADMPFMSYQADISEAVKNAGRFVTKAGADIIKIEATEAYLPVIKAVSDTGISVMAHIGLTPQWRKYAAEGITAASGIHLIRLAEKMLTAGAGSLLLEAVAREIAKIITDKSEVPVISCGSGPDCDGQILISNDILGLTEGKMPKFAKAFGSLADPTLRALSKYSQQIHNKTYPNDKHSYHVKKSELEKLRQFLINDG